MNIEQIYLDLLSYYDTLPEPKVSRTAWFYGDMGVKQTIENARPNMYTHAIDRTGLHEHALEIIKDCLESDGFTRYPENDSHIIKLWLEEEKNGQI